MKIAGLADIHSNFPALQAVADDLERWKPDYVVVNGDLVNRGPRPAECLEFVLRKVKSDGWLIVRGNHEDYVILHAGPEAPRTTVEREVHQASHWTYCQLGKDVSALVEMPVAQSIIDPDGGLVYFTHGSVLGMRDGIYPETSDLQLRKKIGLNGKSREKEDSLKAFVVGHTHRALVREIEQTLVVNAGSVGLPFDHDRRAGYARLTWKDGRWDAEIVRLEYDFARAVQDFQATGYLSHGGPLVELVLKELQESRSHLYGWAIRYQELALEDQISVRVSVDRYLESVGAGK
ncbi:MAG: metallophosphoesterase family protein [Anaerolineales bacterium]|nr:metallophosphoesterase family protein [Anaerolineales bacterium]